MLRKASLLPSIQMPSRSFAPSSRSPKIVSRSSSVIASRYSLAKPCICGVSQTESGSSWPRDRLSFFLTDVIPLIHTPIIVICEYAEATISATAVTREKGTGDESHENRESIPGLRRAAAYCNVHRTTIWRAVKADRLRATGPGRAVRFHRDDLDVWMHSRNRKK